MVYGKYQNNISVTDYIKIYVTESNILQNGRKLIKSILYWLWINKMI